jgi:hypothetical protein
MEMSRTARRVLGAIFCLYACVAVPVVGAYIVVSSRKQGCPSDLLSTPQTSACLERLDNIVPFVIALWAVLLLTVFLVVGVVVYLYSAAHVRNVDTQV